jgi:hypothetical protein
MAAVAIKALRNQLQAQRQGVAGRRKGRMALPAVPAERRTRTR